MSVTWTQKSKEYGRGSGVAIDSTGSFVIAGTKVYEVKKTINQGTSWSSCNPTTFYGPFFSPSVDSDGSHIIAVYTIDSGQSISFSVNSGASWSGNIISNTTSCDIDSDGSVMLAGTTTRLYKSVNSGTDWTEIQPAGNVDKNWTSVCCSSDGSVIYAGNTLRLYKSTDTGANWSEVRPAGDANKSWSSVRCSSDGTIIIAQISSGRTYKSINSGANWSEIAPSGTASDNNYIVDLSDDGTVMIAYKFNENGRCYISQNTGASWYETRPNGDTDYIWSLAISGDGTKLWAVPYEVGSTHYYGVIAPAANTTNFFQFI